MLAGGKRMKFNPEIEIARSRVETLASGRAEKINSADAEFVAETDQIVTMGFNRGSDSR